MINISKHGLSKTVYVNNIACNIIKYFSNEVYSREIIRPWVKSIQLTCVTTDSDSNRSEIKIKHFPLIVKGPEWNRWWKIVTLWQWNHRLLVKGKVMVTISLKRRFPCQSHRELHLLSARWHKLWSFRWLRLWHTILHTVSFYCSTNWYFFLPISIVNKYANVYMWAFSDVGGMKVKGSPARDAIFENVI